jgi:flavin reductase (DIM6/NTAB) family NADH-FMN oxidoreductase RutF
LEKCEELGIHEVSCEKIDCFRVKEALGWLECEVVEEKELGDNVMFVGKVLLSQFDRDDKRPFHIEGSRFTTTRE